MARHNETGKLGEILAHKYFLEAGYDILASNWRHKRNEVDIIATKGEMLHFIEVKCRRSLVFGYPEESVSKAKIRNLIDASEEFLYQNPKHERIQFDVLAINLNGVEATYFLIEDIYL